MERKNTPMPYFKRISKTVLHALRVDNHASHRRLVRWLWAVSGLLVLIALAVYYQQGAIGFHYDRPYKNDVQRFQTWVLQEKERLLEGAQDLAADPSILQLIRDRKTATLGTVLAHEQERLGVSGIVAIDQDGIALMRSGVPGVRGDVVFQSSAWGRRVALGQSLTTIEAGTGYPLIFIAAVPILVQGQVRGAIGVADFLNEEFLVRSASAHLPRGSLVVAYTPEDGYLASNTSDPEQATLLSEYFNPGSDWVRQKQEPALFTLEGSKFVGINLVAPGLEVSPGGMVLFLPFHQQLRSILLSLPGLALVVTLALNLLVHSRKKFHRYWKWIVATGVVLFVLRLALTTYLPNRNAISIAQPTYTIYNSVLSLDPSSRVFNQAFEQRVSIRLVTGGETVNAVQAVVQFDPKLVTVTKLVTTESLCSPNLMVTKNIDPAGTLTIACGVTPPGFRGPKGTVADIIFQPKQPGTASFHFAATTSVRASDGLGTNVLRTMTDGSYTIVSSASKGDGGTVVTSPSHPNADQWYGAADVRFAWTTSAKTLLYAFDRLPNTVPSGTQATNARAIRFHVSSDGPYYFHIAPILGVAPGPTVHRRVMVDATPPEALSISVSEAQVKRNAILRVQLYAQDQLSGLQRTYYFKIDRGTFLPVGSNVDVSFEKTGTHTLTLRAFDNAGNYAEASTQVKVKK